MLDIQKHLSVFDPAKCTGSTLVVGAGSVGSALVVQLTKLGMHDLGVYDFDRVEAHNIANQMFAMEQIGMYKVEALKIITEKLAGIGFHSGAVKFGDLKWRGTMERVFLCVDTMKARKEIWRNCIDLNPHVKHLVDVRISARQILLYSFDPRDTLESKAYVESLHDDVEVTPNIGTCGLTLSIGATAQMSACLATWALIDRTNGTPQYNELALSLHDMVMTKRMYPSTRGGLRAA